jgi:hypothetical protein
MISLRVQMLIWNSCGAVSFKGEAFWLDNIFVSNFCITVYYSLISLKDFGT